MTADINTFKTEGKKTAAIFTTFLNVKGKIIFDAILAKPLLANQRDEDMEFWMDVAAVDLETAIKHMKVIIYDFKSHIEICNSQEGADSGYISPDQVLLSLDRARCRL